MKKGFYSIIAVGLLVLTVSSAFLGCQARMPGDDDPQGASSPSKEDIKK